MASNLSKIFPVIFSSYNVSPIEACNRFIKVLCVPHFSHQNFPNLYIYISNLHIAHTQSKLCIKLRHVADETRFCRPDHTGKEKASSSHFGPGA